MSKRALVVTPEEAKIFISQPLYEGADKEAVIAVTAHEVEGGAACNLWVKYGGVWGRLQPERFVEHEPSIHMLLGELVRLAQSEMAPQVWEDAHLQLGVKGLFAQITAQISNAE